MLYFHLKEILKNKNISVNKFSKDTGINRASLNGIIRNESKMVGIGTLEKICQTLNITLKDLLNERPIKESIKLNISLIKDNKKITGDFTIICSNYFSFKCKFDIWGGSIIFMDLDSNDLDNLNKESIIHDRLWKVLQNTYTLKQQMIITKTIASTIYDICKNNGMDFDDSIYEKNNINGGELLFIDRISNVLIGHFKVDSDNNLKEIETTNSKSKLVDMVDKKFIPFYLNDKKIL